MSSGAQCWTVLAILAVGLAGCDSPEQTFESRQPRFDGGGRVPVSPPETVDSGFPEQIVRDAGQAPDAGPERLAEHQPCKAGGVELGRCDWGLGCFESRDRSRGSCKGVCLHDNQCPAGETCKVEIFLGDGVCGVWSAPPGACEAFFDGPRGCADAPSPSGAWGICVHGSCKYACSSSATGEEFSCPSGTRCVHTSGVTSLDDSGWYHICEACVPSCAGKNCGGDGCGGSCGSCTGSQACNAFSGLCGCASQCAGKQCGPDGCGGSCGSCSTNEVCSSGGVCTCTPSCTGKQCGSDGCGGSCGSCSAGSQCGGTGSCSACVPSCSGKQCGSDGCGGSCGSCPGTTSCSAGACLQLPCNPATQTGCSGGQRCVLSGGTSVCTAVGPGLRGQSCASENCGAGLGCDLSGGVCRQFCNSDSDCQEGSCTLELSGSSTVKMCSLPCDPTHSPSGCRPGLGCTVFNTSLDSEVVDCRHLGVGVSGSSCSKVGDCLSGYSCHAGQCRKLCAAGSTCSSGSCLQVTGWNNFGVCP